MVATDTSLISQLWRYPFKSMGGECISRTVISQTGVLGDRRWAVRKVDQTGNAKQFPSLMNMMAHYPSEPTPKKIPAPVLTLPDGSTVIADHPLQRHVYQRCSTRKSVSRWFGQRRISSSIAA